MGIKPHKKDKLRFIKITQELIDKPEFIDIRVSKLAILLKHDPQNICDLLDWDSDIKYNMHSKIDKGDLQRMLTNIADISIPDNSRVKVYIPKPKKSNPSAFIKSSAIETNRRKH